MPRSGAATPTAEMLDTGATDLSTVKDKSTFGEQVMSTRVSQPSYGFGNSKRSTNSKVFYTKAYTDSTRGMSSPGPVYNLPSSIGPQATSRNGTSPSFKFGARTDVSGRKESPPGPGEYGTGKEALGPQATSNCKTGSSWKFGLSNRWSSNTQDFNAAFQTPGSHNPRPATGWLGDSSKYSFGSSKRHEIGKGNPGANPSFRQNPAPGSYTMPSSLGQQSLSKKNSASQFKFGTSTRDSLKKVYITQGHEREYIGFHSPSPNSYRVTSSLGQQWVSRKKSSKNFKFGTADRFSEIRPIRGNLPVLSPGRAPTASSARALYVCVGAGRIV